MMTATEQARLHLIEEIMAIEGRAASRPKVYRAFLERLPFEDLARRKNDLLDKPFSAPAEALPIEQIEAKPRGREWRELFFNRGDA